MLNKLTEKLDSFLELDMPFYDCVVYKNGKCVYRHSNGYTDIKNGVKVNGKEKYNIYSCTKLMTCVAGLQLLEKGLFSLDDKLSTYMPEFADMTVRVGDEIVPAKTPILIKHLFSMSAGFSYNLNSPELVKCKQETNGECSTRETMRYLAKEPLLFEPGEGWQYSLCHDVLGAFIEVISGETLADYFKKNIFIPLKMFDTTLSVDKDLENELVNQYEYAEGLGTYEIGKNCIYRLGTKFHSGGAGCVSTVDDYIKFLEAVRIGDVILKKETTALLETNVLSEKQLEAFFVKGYGYSLGQRCPKDNDKTDFGWSGAGGAWYAIDKEHNFTIFVGTHVKGNARYKDYRYELLPIIREI